MDARLLPHIHYVLLLTLSIGNAKDVIASEITSKDIVRCIPKEREALLKFKNALERSERLASWGSKGNETECCKWNGVRCSNATGHVTWLNLSESYNECVIDPSLLELQHLNYLNLSYNDHRNCGIPAFIGHLSELVVLDLSNSGFHGVISENHFKNLSNLKYLSLSNNSLTLRFSSNWIPPFRSDSIYLGSCNLGPHFPDWLKTQINISVLDISSSQISASIPNWFWNLSSEMRLLNISNNEIYGAVPTFSSTITDLSSNRFEGPLPLFPENAIFVDLSKNMFSGPISSICESSGWLLQILDLSDNLLSDGFPECWNKQKFQFLRYLSLSNNQLTGKISSTSFVPNCQLYSLYLKNNSLVGELPVSLGYCNRLRVFDVGYNMLSGTLPGWIGAKFTDLSIFILRSNQFSGTIPSNLCWLRKIQVLDLSRNNISGAVIKCLSNSTALTTRENLKDASDANQYIDIVYPGTGTIQSPNYYDLIRVDDVSLLWKGIEREYSSILRLMKTVDFSGNNLQGEIPEEFGSLVGLVQLNMSHNNLNGHIPQKIGEMRELQVLDLSTNQLSGEIPQSISSLSFLSHFDVSDNNLTGRIPAGTQIQTQNVSHFMGNMGLCGLPLPKECQPAEAPAPEIGSLKDEDGIISEGFYISMGVGFVIGFWGVLGCLLFANAWSSAYFRFLNSAVDWLYVTSQLMKARLRTLAH